MADPEQKKAFDSLSRINLGPVAEEL
jgi:hypothetical protein